MINNNNKTPFDNKLKDTFKDYEAPNSSANWSRMEGMLNAAPKANNFKWKTALNVIIGVVVVSGGYLIYQAIPSSPKAEQQIEQKSEEAKQEEIPVVISTDDNKQAENNNNQESENEVVVSEPIKIAEDASLVSKKEESKQVVVEKKTKDKETLKGEKIFKMGNEPIFGDMLDSSKGIIGKTQEKEEIKKAAKDQTHAKTNWNDFLFSPVLPDSIKKNRERMKADSLKTE